MTFSAPATCTQDGIEEYFCTGCSHCYVVSSPALGHHYQETVTPPTCTQAGHSTFTCNSCSDSYIDTKTTELGHSYGPWLTVTKTTVLQEGLQERFCSVCSQRQTEAVARLQLDEIMRDKSAKQIIICGVASVSGSILLLWVGICKKKRRK